jgi:hypothetical protein
MQPTISEAAAFLGNHPQALANVGIGGPGRPISQVIRQQPMALHARRSL